MPIDMEARFRKFKEEREKKKRRGIERKEREIEKRKREEQEGRRSNAERFEWNNTNAAPQKHLFQHPFPPPIQRYCEAREDEFFLVQKGASPKKRKHDGQASVPPYKKQRKSEKENIVPVRIEISEPVVEISTESVKQPEFVPPVSVEPMPTVTQSTSAPQSTCESASASAPLVPSTELPLNASSRRYIVRKKKNVVLDPAPVKDSANRNTSANNSSEAVTLDSRRIKFDSSESRSNVCSLLEMDANSLYKQARSIKHTGDKLEANMFQRILHYADAAVLYLAHVVKTGPRAESLLKGTVTFCDVFQQIRQQQSYTEKDKLDKLQAISSMILSLIHFNLYQFNYESLHSRLEASLTNHRVTKTSSPAADSAEPATGAVSSSTPSVVSSSSTANGTEQPAPSSSVPHFLWLEGEKYLNLIEDLSKAHDIWREAKMLTRLQENVDFFTNMDVEYGPLEMTSPINYVMEYLMVAIFRLRNLTAT